MKKTKTLLFCLLTFLMIGCSNEDHYERGSSDTNRSKTAHWYGVKQLQDSVSLRSAADRMKLWTQDPVITVKFLNNPDDPAMLDQIKTYAKEWEQYAGVTFQFVESTEKALVRIGFDWDGNSWLTWSYTGNDAKMVRNQNEPTACFGGLNDGVMSDEEIKGDVLRVFGQILGLEFEQRHSEWDASWWKKDKNGVYYAQKYWENMFDGYYENFDWETIREFVFDPLAGATIVQTPDVDFESIMMWPYYTRKETVKLVANYELSDSDKEFIATLYPKKEGNTIQTAWVDAGYFVWVNAEKTQLRITEKGAQLEELPDVVDGEQLTTTNNMFVVKPSYIQVYAKKLKKAPKFNTSNVTDFSWMFRGCLNLREVPLYDTSNGIYFNSMFSGCTYLRNIPAYNTSKGVSFSGMFSTCQMLEKVPYLDTANGVDFQNMFWGCENLQEIPQYNTSNGVMFGGMFAYSGLTEIPTMDFSKGENFFSMFSGSKIRKVFIADLSNAVDPRYMFRACSDLVDVSLPILPKARDIQAMFFRCYSLKNVSAINAPEAISAKSLFDECTSLEVSPEINLPKAENLSYFFEGCKSLVTVSPINVPAAKDLTQMFHNCRSLRTVPLFDMSKAESLINLFLGCEKLTEVPAFNTSNVKKFASMFSSCTALETVPLLDTSKGEFFTSMFSGCSSLTSVPALDTSNGLFFGWMFSACTSLEELPVLDVSKGKNFQEMFGTYNNQLVSKVRKVYLKGFGKAEFSKSGNESDGSLDISSAVLDVSSLQYLIDNTTGGTYTWTINLHKALQSQVSASLMAQAAAKNIKIEFIY